MVKVVGVRFRTAGKIYFFDPGKFQINKNDNVIVETARGIEFGTVVGDIREVEEDKVVQPLKPVLRIANQRDKEQEAENKKKEKEAFEICLEKIHKHGLEMKLIDAEYTFDNNKVLFYFTADGRIDFRELVKDLAGVFKTRIELRQIGVRDETKTVGGIGICGRVLCCHGYLSDFIPVSIKMAKEQNLSLNPTKISGVCGRLMCCLKYEEETYEELNRRMPNVGDFVTTEDGMKGEVQSVNVLRQLVKVIVETNDEKEIREYELDQIRSRKKHGKKDRPDANLEEIASMDDSLSREDLKALELLEKEEDEETAEREEKAEQEAQEDSAHSARSVKGERGKRSGRNERTSNSRSNKSSEKTENPGKQEAKPAEKSDRSDAHHEKNKKNNRNDRNRNNGKENSTRGEKNRSVQPVTQAENEIPAEKREKQGKSKRSRYRRPNRKPADGEGRNTERNDNKAEK